MGPKLINIDFSSTPGYRYRMPEMALRKEGRGNGIRTIIENMRDLATALNRPTEIVTKWFGFEVGSYTKYDKTTGFARIAGVHSLKDLNAHLKVFIDHYVMCPKCGLPETVFVPDGDKTECHCKACGYNDIFTGAHRIVAIIEKQLRSSGKTESHKRKKGKDKSSMKVVDPVEEISKALLDSKDASTISTMLHEFREEGILKKRERIPCLIAASFTSSEDIRKTTHLPILGELLSDKPLDQALMLRCCEILVHRHSELLASKGSLSGFFQQLYECGALEYDGLKVWSESKEGPFFLGEEHHGVCVQYALPFVEWMNSNQGEVEYEVEYEVEEYEEEEEDEEEEEGEE
ncbi:Eukaryotic translation initiation factor 5 [Aduncisulcus paluster]|uniref:Eukaryotic translation initiation factor 5 n=1 Tax=Aduncisulcus paluster TaxID=2918883 RepID=A0ABQ5KHX5_9EUKA|nr:Eukaryotic translation initiation factor 5 [Aduncisulcus paluster]